MPIRWGKELEYDKDIVWGCYNETNRGGFIALDSTMEKGRLLSVFLHEVVHAIDETYGVGLSHRQVNGLGEGLAQALGSWLKVRK